MEQMFYIRWCLGFNQIHLYIWMINLKTKRFKLYNVEQLSLLMSGQPTQDRSSFKYHFMAKVMQQSQQQQMYRPMRSSLTQEQSAKEIMKQAIIMENKSTPRHHPMKGQLISGYKKPIQEHMHSFLLGIRQQIRKQYDKTQLPLLRSPTPPTATTHEPNTPTNKKTQINFLRRLRQSKAGWGTIETHKQISPRKPNTTDTSATISHSQHSHNRQKATSNTLPRTISPSPPPSLPSSPLKKGYIAYHPEAAQFLATQRANAAKKPMREWGSAGITAGAYLVMQSDTLLPVVSKKAQQRIQIASLSKIMTCYLTLLLCEKYNIDPYRHEVRVSERAAQTPGTTAELQRGDIVSVYDLLFGLMLPSGNDASVALAESMGKVIQRHKKKPTKKTTYETFIAHMNLLSRELQLDQSWNNSSGLSMNPNHSTPTSIAILTTLAIQLPLFRQVINTRSHSADIRNDWFGINRKATWRNTNKLLESGWQGVKTGTTETAGHCLMALKEGLIVCVFACQTLAKRFTECQSLLQQCSRS